MYHKIFSIRGIPSPERLLFLRQALARSFEIIKIHILNLHRKPLPLFVKIFLACLGGLLTILVAVSLIVDPNHYKESIEKLVLEQTGKTLILEGPLQLRCFPTFALQADNVILKEKPNKKRAILKIQSLRIYPSLWSLLPGRTVFNLSLSGAQIKSFFIPELKTKITHKKGIYELATTQIGVKRGKKLEMLEIDKLRVDTSQDIFKYNLYHHGGNFQLELLLDMFGLKNHLVGKTNLKMDLNAEGDTIGSIKNSLRGNLEIDISNGRFHGIDLISSLKDAKSILGTLLSGIGKPFAAVIHAIGPKENKLLTERTPFKALNIKASIKEGLIHNHDFNIQHNHYSVKGKGKINLIQNTVDYRFKAFYKGDNFKKKKHLKKKLLPLVIDISGSIENPNIKPDLQSYLEYIQ